MVKNGQNGNGIPFSGMTTRELAERLKRTPDADLFRFAKEHRQQFFGRMRSAVDHARLTGAALAEIKARLKGNKGAWTEWLGENFDGSEETARLYMRVAENWDRVVAHGLDRLPELTLTDLRFFLSDPQKPTTTARRATPPPEPDTEPGGPEQAENETDDAPRVEVRQYRVLLDADEMAEFGRMVRGLKDALPADTEHDAIFHAVQKTYEEVCR